jgi:hypothetical protein
MLSTLNIIFEIEGQKYFCEINVFDRPSDLELKLEKITNNKYRRHDSILKVKGILAYFFGDDTLINFEHVYDWVIRKQCLEVECEQKNAGNDQNIYENKNRIYFWKKKARKHNDDDEDSSSFMSENLDDFKDFIPIGRIPRITDDGKHIVNDVTGDLNEQFYITLRGWKDLFKVFEFAVEDNVEVNNSAKAEMFFDNEETANVNKGMFSMHKF